MGIGIFWDETGKGIVISVPDESFGDDLGIQIGDALVSIDGQNLTSGLADSEALKERNQKLKNKASSMVFEIDE